MGTPFRQYSDNNYGTHGSQEGVPLRRRNEMFGHPQSSFSEFPYPPYSELPFTSLKRRKQPGVKFVRWTMLAVLASPVVALVLWSTCAFLFTSSQLKLEAAPAKKAMRSSARTSKRSKGANGHMIPVINPMGASGGASDQTLALLPQPPQQQAAAGPVYGIQGSNLVLQPPSLNQQQPAFMAAAPAYMVNPESFMLVNQEQQPLQLQQQPMQLQQQQQPIQLQQQQLQQQQLQQQQQQPLQQYTPAVDNPTLGASTTSNNDQTSAVAPAPFRHMDDHDVQRMLIPLGSTYSSASATTDSSTTPDLSNQPPILPPLLAHASNSGRVDGVTVRHRPAPRGSNIVEPPPQQQTINQSANQSEIIPTKRQKVYYYYDANDATDEYGQLKVPSVVYDSNGTPIQMQALSNAQVFLEPPPPKKYIKSIREYKGWGESTMQDQSIIISTVAVMALLVGALSARRLRSRSFLSSCIENESLEDDVAYDTAYTTTDNSYNTFGGWKGDLEKFDV